MCDNNVQQQKIWTDLTDSEKIEQLKMEQNMLFANTAKLFDMIRDIKKQQQEKVRLESDNE